MRAVGADVFAGRWVALAFEDGTLRGGDVVERFSQVLDLADGTGAHAVGVDIPIGTPLQGRRVIDQQARDLVRPRHASVFATPPWAVLHQPDYTTAAALAVELTGQGLSRQAFGLRAKILEVAEVARDREDVFEVHPEVSFRALAGAPLAWGKRTWSGLLTRCRLLAAAGMALPDRPEAWGGAGTAAPDDVLDAAAVAWSAERIAAGRAERLVEPGPTAPSGRQAAIWY